MRGKVRLNAGAKKAIAGWQAEAERVRKERESDPHAFTTGEFAKASGMSVNIAYNYLAKRMADGAYRRSRKILGGKLVPAWVEV